MPTQELVVLCLDEVDAAMWRAENPELADAARIVLGHDWEPVVDLVFEGVWPFTVCLGWAAAQAAWIGGVNPPRAIRLALTLAEDRRPAYLKVVA